MLKFIKKIIEFIQQILKKYKLEEFARFVMVGGTATVLNYGIYFLLVTLVQRETILFISFENIAFTIGFALSFIFNLVASHLFTFKTKVSVENGFRFGLAQFTNYLIQMGLLNFFIFVGVPEKFAPLPGFVIAFFVNYFVVRFALKSKWFRIKKNKEEYLNKLK